MKDDEFLHVRDYCRDNGFGIHLTRFFDPAFLDTDIIPYTEYLKKQLIGIKSVSVHAPFLDLVVVSPDKLIREAARIRHEKALNAAFLLSADSYVIHTGYNPLIKNERYDNGFVQRLLSFWLPYADRSFEHGLTFCFENVWDKDPFLLSEIVQKASHPSIKALFDNGHALISSQLNSEEWIKHLGASIFALHLHDNRGDTDSHLPLGQANENISMLKKAIDLYAPDARLIFECAKLSENIESYNALCES